MMYDSVDTEPTLDQNSGDEPPPLPYLNPISLAPPSNSLQTCQSNSTHSPLLRLAPEIRQIIYNYALGNLWITISDLPYPQEGVKYAAEPLPEPLLIPKPHGTWPNVAHANTPLRRFHIFAVPLACRQLYAECHLLVYSLNTFYFPRVNDIQAFFDRLTDDWQPIQIDRQKSEAVRCIVPPYKTVDWVLERSELPFSEIFPKLDIIYLDAERIRGEWNADLWREYLEELEQSSAKARNSTHFARVKLLERTKDI